LVSYPLGILADKIGLKKVFISGLVLFAIVYFGFAMNTNLYVFFALFFIYGIYAAATEGISKAWISNIAAKEETATAIGTYTAFQSICTMLASSLTGLIWYNFSAKIAFLLTASIAVIVVFYLLFIKIKTFEK
jgi:MFS family permease